MHEPITEAAYNTAKSSAAKFWLVQLFGKQAELVQGERRFQTRRFFNTTYLMDRRLVDRRASQQQES